MLYIFKCLFLPIQLKEDANLKKVFSFLSFVGIPGLLDGPKDVECIALVE